MTVKFRVSDATEWAELLKSCRLATPFHQWDWLKILEDHSGSRLYPLVALNNESPVALFPLFLQKKGFFSLAFSPPPHFSVPFLGPLFLSDDSLKQNKLESQMLDFESAASSFIFNDLNASFARLNLPPGMLDVRAFKWAGYSAEPFFNYTTDLSIGKEKVWSGLNKDIRNEVGKMKREGVEVRQGSEKEFNLLFDLMEERYKEQGIPTAASRQYFLDIFSSFKDDLALLCAFSGEEFLGGILDIRFRDTSYSWIGLPKAREGVNALLQWSAIESALDKGFKTYFEIGANTQKLLPFKSKFNPTLSTYFSVQKTKSRSLSLINQVRFFSTLYTRI